jgi:hypothetical protein
VKKAKEVKAPTKEVKEATKEEKIEEKKDQWHVTSLQTFFD